jgi:hypothetical protein
MRRRKNSFTPLLPFYPYFPLPAAAIRFVFLAYLYFLFSNIIKYGAESVTL